MNELSGQHPERTSILLQERSEKDIPRTEETDNENPMSVIKLNDSIVKLRIQDLLHSLSEADNLTVKKNPEQSTSPFDLRKEVVDRSVYTVLEVKDGSLGSAFGTVVDSEKNIIAVRADLPDRVKKFVLAHERFHCEDNSFFGGQLGREFRANFFPGLRDPIGLLSTIWMTVSSKERMQFYKMRFKTWF